jgi:succinyl-CoA synthetase beta subunit
MIEKTVETPQGKKCSCWRALQAAEQMENLYKLFVDVDATQVEINPFGETDTGRGIRDSYLYVVRVGPESNRCTSPCPMAVVCFDAKINFDDNAEFRQKRIFEQRDIAEEDPREVQASKFSLNYIGMEGNIGCLGL